MFKSFCRILGFLMIGIFGGILSHAFVLPYLAEHSYANAFHFVKKYNERELVINNREEIIIQENVAFKNAIEKTEKAIVGIKSVTKMGKRISGSGLIVSSDGLILTLSDIAPKQSQVTLFLDGREFSAEILQRNSDFVLLKIDISNLYTVSFFEFEKIKLGENIFLLGVVFQTQEDGKEIVRKIVNQGIVKYFTQNAIHTNIFEKYYLSGSSLFDIEGNLVGMNTIDIEGKVITIPSFKIKEFLGF